MWSFLSCYLSCKRFTFDRIGLRGVFQNIGWRYAKARANPIRYERESDEGGAQRVG